jgi:hypothetical protein
LRNLLVGRRIWVNTARLGLPETLYDTRVLSFKRFLPAGPVAEKEPNSPDGIRSRPLIQIYTDPGGMRVLAVDEIRLKDPRRRR